MATGDVYLPRLHSAVRCAPLFRRLHSRARANGRVGDAVRNATFFACSRGAPLEITGIRLRNGGLLKNMRVQA